MSSDDKYKAGRKKRQARRKTPLSLRMLRLYFQTVGRFLPGIAVNTAYRLWFQTRRFSEPARELRWLNGARQDVVEHAYGPLAVNVWEGGPTVLLVHGWNGRGSQMGSFAQPLADRGYRVVAFDLPAHGRSPGNSTDIFKAVETLEAIGDTYGPIHGVIAHSFGVMVTTLALREGLEIHRFAAISPPNSLHWLVERFETILNIPAPTHHALVQRIEANYGKDIWDKVALNKIARGLNIPALIVHDDHDYDVAWEQGKTLADAWPGAVFIKTTGLGHRRILRDRAVIHEVVEFIDNN
ncbi:MAG: alpha/beta hydrolase [Acidiferrobacterales bacterium]|jgi:pimeloyl-ACP methyl ester carboxylesterase|nr:alpha/beta hydrolase [Acidiferrobacterales bacterium]